MDPLTSEAGAHLLIGLRDELLGGSDRADCGIEGKVCNLAYFLKKPKVLYVEVDI